MEKFFITFGFDSMFNGKYLEINAESEEDARKATSYLFRNWAGIYKANTAGEFELANRYKWAKLTEVTVTPEMVANYKDY